MRIEFSRHARERIKFRGISKTRVIQTIHKPDEAVAGIRSRKLIRRKYGDKMLEVITVVEGQKIMMKIKYDKKIDAVYIEFARGKYSKSRKISGSILVDEDEKGKILGVEILDATKNVEAFDPRKMKANLQTWTP